MNRHKYLLTMVYKRREMCWNVYTYCFSKRIATSKMFFHSSCAALRLVISTILVDLFCHTCWNRIACTYSGLWMSEKALLLVVLQVLMEWEDQAQVLLLCGCRAHSREQGGERSAHGIPSSHFRVKKTIKMVIFSITLTVTLLVFFLLLDFGKWEDFVLYWNESVLAFRRNRYISQAFLKCDTDLRQKNILWDYLWLSDLKLILQLGKI